MWRNEGTKDIEELIFLHRRRLRLLQRRAAIEGISVDPMVIIQIEDTLATIEKLEQERAQLDVPSMPAQLAINRRTEVELILMDARYGVPERIDGVMRMLSNILNVSCEHISIVQSSDAAGMVHMELPIVAANRLFALFQAGDYRLQGFGIQEIRVVYRLPFQFTSLLAQRNSEQSQESGIDQSVRSEGEDDMHKKVLIVDNDSSYLDATARFLEVIGYDVYRAVSLEQARQLLDYSWVHVALIDVRMRDDTDRYDTSGLLLAKDPLYRCVPKIMLTQHPTYDYVREALGPDSTGLAPAVDFHNKLEETEAIVRALEQTFEQRVRLNRHLVITWNQPLTFPYLVNLIQSEQDNERLLDRAGELEDLFRKLFYDSSQLTIGRVLTHRAGWLQLEVFAYGEAGNERQFVVSCGKKAQIVDENRRYDEVVPHGAGVGSTIKQPGAETLRFAATPYILVGGDLEAMISFRDYYNSRPAEAVAASLNHLYTATLPPWYQRGREQQHDANLSELYWRGLGLDEALLAPDALAQRIEAIGRQMLAAGLVAGTEFAPHGITLRFADGESFAYANPIAEHYEERVNLGAPALYGVVHGNINPDSILVDTMSRTWLFDFMHAGRGLLLQDFIVLETAMKLEMLETLDLQARHLLELRLLDPTTLDDAPIVQDLPPELQRMAGAIRHIRASAADLTGDNLASYRVGMFFCALKYVATYDPALHYARRKFIPYAHGLMLSAMLYESLAKLPDQAEQQPLPVFRLDVTNQIARLGDRQIDLTPREFQLLAFLYDQAGHLCTRQAITTHMLDIEYDTTDESWLNSLLNRLRRKLEPDPDRPRYLLTVRGRGYKLVVAPA